MPHMLTFFPIKIINNNNIIVVENNGLQNVPVR